MRVWTSVVVVVCFCVAACGGSNEPFLDTGTDVAADAPDVGDARDVAPDVGDARDDAPESVDAGPDDSRTDAAPDVTPDAADMSDAQPDAADGQADTEPDTTPDVIDAGVDCGNGVLDDGEACDGEQLGDATCATLGYWGQGVACSATCALLAGDCRTTPVCGDGFIDGRETCDDSNVEADDGCSADCQIEPCHAGIRLQWYSDEDGDGVGAGEATPSCERPFPGAVNTSSDCNDVDPLRAPGLAERCDGSDNDCDEAIDEDVRVVGDACVTGLEGECAQGRIACDGGEQTCVGNPPTDESCDALDNDCDGLVDEDDAGDPLRRSCFTGAAERLDVGVCRAGSEACNVGTWSACVGQQLPLAERCDNVDNDCNGSIDDALIDTGSPCLTGLGGACSDGITACTDGVRSCEVVPRASLVEVCNGVDDDCDGAIDESATGAVLERTCYTGPAGTLGVGVCAAGIQVCADSQLGGCAGQVLPDDEACDGLDNDCDGVIDEEVVVRSWYIDGDGDGVGAGDAVTNCASPGPGYVTATGDCNDSDASISPGATETLNGRDDNCDLRIDDTTSAWDDDGDGYCELAPCVLGNPGGDCDDRTVLRNPGMVELVDGLDNDCDGEVDNGTLAHDDDGDGYCEVAPCVTGILGGGDCSDVDPEIYPGAPERNNGLDDNCNGVFDDLKTWIGGNASGPTNWSIAANWAPVGVPTATDKVYVGPRPFAPLLTANSVAGSLWIDAAMQVDTGGFRLTVSGDLVGAGPIVGTGSVTLSGSAANVRGAVPRLDVTGTLALSGDLSVTGNATISNTGSLWLAGAGALSVTGSFTQTVRNNGGLRMNEPEDRVTVAQNVSFNVEATPSTNSGAALSAGEFRVRGNFAQTDNDTFANAPSAPFNFSPSGTRFIFDGTSPQTIAMESPSATKAQFGPVRIENTAGVAATTTVVMESLSVASGATFSAADALFTGALPEWDATTRARYLIDRLHVAGALAWTSAEQAQRCAPSALLVDAGAQLSSTLAITQVGCTLTVNGTLNLNQQTWRFDAPVTVSAGVVAGPGIAEASQTVDVASNGRIELQGGALTTQGALTLATGGDVLLGGGSLTVGGALNLSGAGSLLRLSGGRAEVNGATTIRWGPSRPQGLWMDNPGDVFVANGAIAFSALNFEDALSAPALTAGTLRVRGNFTQSSALNVESTFRSAGTAVVFDGTSPQTVSFATPTLIGSSFADVTFANPTSVSLATTVWATGNVQVTAGVLAGADLFCTRVLPEAIAPGVYSVSETHVAASFVTTDTSIELPLLTVDDNMTLTLSDTTRLTGDLLNLGSFEQNGHDLDVIGSITITDGIHNMDGGALTVSGATLVNGSTTSGLFVGGGSATLASYQASMGGSNPFGLVMTAPADRVVITGRFTVNEQNFYAGTTANALTAGQLEIRGNLTQTGATGSVGRSFIPSGTRVVLNGTSPQTVSIGTSSATTSRFGTLHLDNPAGITFSTNAWVDGPFTMSAGAVASGGDLTFTRALPRVSAGYSVANTHISAPGFSPDLSALNVPRLVIDAGSSVTLTDELVLSGSLRVQGTLNLAGFNLTTAGTVDVNGGSVDLSTGTLDIGTDLNVRDDAAVVVLRGGTLRVGRDLLVLLSDSNTGLVMNHPDDRLFVDRNLQFTTLNLEITSTEGRFTEGEIEVGGNWFALDGVSTQGRTIVLTGTDVRFVGTTTLTNFDGGPSQNRFTNITIAPGASVTLESPVTYATGDVLVQGTLVLQGLKRLEVVGNVRVVAGGTLNNGGNIVAGSCLVEPGATRLGSGSGCP
ncbi:MAG: hypothetical protein KGO50_04825 [Myxococcales bacterium]|nr:hypothetical protein [Myxococcales bacterium]